MNLMQNFRALLERPISAAPAKAPPGRRTGRAETTAAPEPLTAAELEAALRLAFAERQRAEETLAAAATRRAELLLADDDDALLDADRLTNLAAIAIERLDAIEPKLHARLREVRGIEKAKRFAELRQELIAAASAIVPALRAAADATAPWRKMRDAAVSEFRGSEFHIPGLVVVDHRDINQFVADIERFRNVSLEPTPAKPMTNVAEIIAEARRTGQRPDPIMPFCEVVERALLERHVVIALRTWQTADSRTVAPGTEVSTTFEEAEGLTQRGFARWKD